MKLKKSLLLVAGCAMLTFSASAINYSKSTDADAIEAALAKEKSPFRLFTGVMRLAELRTPEKLKSFDGICEVIDAAAEKYGVAQRYVDDAKVSNAFRHRMLKEGYAYAVEVDHPYELLFMAQIRFRSELKKRFTPVEQYEKVMELLDKHVARYDAWNSERYNRQFASLLKLSSKAVPAARFKKDAAKLSARIKPYAARHPQLWEPVIKVLGVAAPERPTFTGAMKYIDNYKKNNPAKGKDFAEICKVIDAKALADNYPERLTEDTKVSYAYRHRLMVPGYRYAVKTKHPYELFFMVHPALQKEINRLYTPVEKYEKVISLLKQHVSRYNEWNSARNISRFSSYLKKVSTAVSAERFANDAGVLMLVIRPYAAKRAKAWKPMTDVLEQAMGK